VKAAGGGVYHVPGSASYVTPPGRPLLPVGPEAAEADGLRANEGNRPVS
jgi:hypothetical protein